MLLCRMVVNPERIGQGFACQGKFGEPPFDADANSEKEAEEERNSEQGDSKGENLIYAAQSGVYPETGRNGNNCQHQQASRRESLFPPAAYPVKELVGNIKKISHNIGE